MLVEMLHTNDPSEDSIMCKFINHHTENQRSEDSEISQKEKAEFFLKLQLQRIEKKLIDIEQRVAECDQKIKSLIKSGQKEHALIYLRKRKLLEGEQTKLHGMTIKLEEQLYAIESASEASMTLETLSMATGVT